MLHGGQKYKGEQGRQIPSSCGRKQELEHMCLGSRIASRRSIDTWGRWIEAEFERGKGGVGGRSSI